MKEKASSKVPANPSVAVELLITDHRRVEDLFEAFEAQEASEARRETALLICKELTVHATIEEELFYPFLRENIEATDLIDEAEVEHASLKELVSQIEAADEVDDMFDAKVKVLKEYVSHHVKEEHEQIFPGLEGLDEELDELGQEMHARKLELGGDLDMLENEAASASLAADLPAALSRGDEADSKDRAGRRAGR